MKGIGDVIHSDMSSSICRICEMAATGNNFGIPTCESCKTFFRRNAKREPKKCLHDGKCKVVMEFRKSCTSCRLNKCFAMGMRKDHILPEEKLKSRAKPHFKKPRFKWCRIPADMDIDMLVQRRYSGTKLPSFMHDHEMDETQSINSVDTSTMFEQPTQVKQEVFDPSDYSSETFGQYLLNVKDQVHTPPSSSECSHGSQVDPRHVEVQCSLDEGLDLEALRLYREVAKDIHNVLSTYTSPYGREFNNILTMQLCNNLEGGFSTLEASVRKMIRVIPMMPFIRTFDKELLGKIVKERVFGCIQIISALTYDHDTDTWSVTMEESSGNLRLVQIKVSEAIRGTFSSLTRPSQGFKPFITMEDVEKIYKVLKDYYFQTTALFGPQKDFAMIILLGIYIFQDDPCLNVTTEQRDIIRVYKTKYITVFRSFLKDACSLCDRRKTIEQEAYLLLQNIRWLEVRYNDGAKQVELTKVPPLMAELAVTFPR